VRKASWCLVVVSVALCAVAGSGWSSPPARSWGFTNLVRVARHRYPAYVGINSFGLGLTGYGAIYWTAHRQDTDGKTLEVFRWKNGQLSDVGSPGRGLGVEGVNDRGQFLVETMVLPVPTGPVGSGVIPLPDIHAYLWQQGKLTSLGSLGGSHTFAQAINDHGQIVGRSDNRQGPRAVTHAFLWQNGTMTDLGTLGGKFSEPTAINDHGQVIGTSQTASGRQHGFIWQNGRMIDLGTLGGGVTNPVAINERGQVIGQSTTPRGTAHNFNGQAFLWQNGKMTELGTLALPGYPISCEQNTILPRCAHPCPHKTACNYWRSVVTAINDEGEVVGMSETDSAAGRAFLWRDGKMTDLGTLGGRSSGATAIDDRGQIVGWSDTRLVPRTAEQAPAPRPLLWQNGKLIELPTRLAVPTRAGAVGRRGLQILGGADYPAGNQVLLWTRTR
jgi:probable HAF family extracellular repeat protein